MAKERGGRGWLFGLVLLVAAGAGAWNYHQNLRAEQAEIRPYRGYSDADLAALIAAYESEAEVLGRRYDAVKGRRSQARDTGFIGDQVQEFERIQREAGRTRAAGADVSERDAALRDLEKERRVRAEERDVLRTFLRRLTTV
jgi:hypothetical protein